MRQIILILAVMCLSDISFGLHAQKRTDLTYGFLNNSDTIQIKKVDIQGYSSGQLLFNADFLMSPCLNRYYYLASEWRINSGLSFRYEGVDYHIPLDRDVVWEEVYLDDNDSVIGRKTLFYSKGSTEETYFDANNQVTSQKTTFLSIENGKNKEIYRDNRDSTSIKTVDYRFTNLFPYENVTIECLVLPCKYAENSEASITLIRKVKYFKKN